MGELIALYRSGRLHDAEAAARKLAKKFPRAPIVFEILGASLAGQGRMADAVSCFQRLVKIDPGRSDAHSNLGLALQHAGRVDEASKSYRKALELNPGNAMAHTNLGIALLKTEKYDEAITAFGRAVEINPSLAEAHNNLGIALRETGRLDEAAASYRRALEIKPDYTEVFNNLGNALQDLGQGEEALGFYGKALSANPDYAEAMVNKGETLLALGRAEEAAASFRDAVRIEPTAGACNALAAALRELEHYEEAAAASRAALEIEPESVEAHVNLGSVLQGLNRHDEAVDSYQAAIALQPGHVEAHCQLGDAHERLNQLDQAREVISRALELAPRHPLANLVHAVLLMRDDRVDEAIGILERFTTSDASGKVLLHIHNELGKLYDIRRDAGQAFRHFREAKALQADSRAAAGLDRSAFLAEAEHTARLVADGWQDTWRNTAVQDVAETPAFIVGFPRSGTTLLDQILDSHPGISVMEEKPILHELKAQISDRRENYMAGLAQCGADDLDRLRRNYFAAVDRYAAREPGKLLVDKYPLNICHIPLIARLFPSARIILCLRHPCDVVLSNFMQVYEMNEAMVNFLDLENAARCYARVMQLWQICAGRLPVCFHTLRYESLIADFEGEISALLDFLGPGWNDAVRGYAAHAAGRRINTPSYQAVTRPINASARYRWKRYEAELRPVMGELAPFIAAFGYGETEGTGDAG